MELFKRKKVIPLLIYIFLSFWFLLSASAPVGAVDISAVYLGGEPIGLVQKCDGVVVSDYLGVETENGLAYPAKDAGILLGDVITAVNDVEIFSATDMAAQITPEKKQCVLTVERGLSYVDITVYPAYDIVQHAKKLGIAVKNEMAGVGTMTYILPDGRFGSVGHKIADPKVSAPNTFQTGDLYDCEIIGVNKGQSGKAGELSGKFSKKDGTVGKVEKNIFCGLFGVRDFQPIGRKLVEIGHKDEVMVGEAYIYSTLDGKFPDAYSIEIVKAEKQNSPREKSMVIKVTDERLLSRAGGIVQGMSGSPIVQNGKLVGAVTHVFLNDATRGYGIYVDWMLENQ